MLGFKFVILILIGVFVRLVLIVWIMLLKFGFVVILNIICLEELLLVYNIVEVWVVLLLVMLLIKLFEICWGW